MKTHVLRGSKEEIAENLLHIKGDVREAIVFVEEAISPEEGPKLQKGEDIFAAMEAFVVDVDDLDDSREAIYSRLEGE